MLRINTISRPVFFTRDGKTVETNSTGEYITHEEFATITSETPVICLDETAGKHYVYTPGAPEPVLEPVLELVPEPVVVTELPATDAGRVPELVSAGSETPKT
jgi:hypothetical protein